MNEDSSDTTVQELDIDTLASDAKIVSMHQRGSFLVCTTNQGIKFTQRIPAGRRLNVKDNKYILE